MITPDSSVLIPALVEWHEHHSTAAAALARDRLRVIGHVMLEVYSTLTGRLSPRVPPATARLALERMERNPLTLSPKGYLELLKRGEERGIMGAQVHDARIAATAAEHGLRLVSRDARAARAYRAMGVEYDLLT